MGEEGPRGDAEKSGEDEDDGHGGNGARETKAFEEGYDRGEKKRKENRESEGKKQDFRHVENGDSENRDGDEPELREDTCRGLSRSLPLPGAK